MESINPILIIGTGPEGRLALDIFNASDVLVYSFLSDKKTEEGQQINDVGIFGSIDNPNAKKVLLEANVDVFVAEGNPVDRKRLQLVVSELTGKPGVNAFHPLGFISPYAKIGFGNLMSAGFALHANAEIGDSNFFHSHVSIEPDTQIGNYCTFNSGVKIGSNVVIGDEVFIGTGAIIHPGVKIGNHAMIGAGSVVLKSVAAGKTVFGNPAKEA